MEPSNELDSLAAQLSDDTANRRGRRAVAPWFELMAERNASDLILVAGEPPTFRIDGRMLRSSGPVLDGDDVYELVAPELAPHAQRSFAITGSPTPRSKCPASDASA